MFIFILAVVGAALAGVLAIWRQPQLPRYGLLLAIAVVPQIGSILGVRIAGMFLISIGTIGLWCYCNYRITGVGIVGLGMGLNSLVMAMHGGAMPIHRDLLAQLGHVAGPGTFLPYSKDVVITASPLWVLSDWLVLSLKEPTIIVSPGDLIVSIGVAWWLLFSHRPDKDEADALNNIRTEPAIPARAE